MRLKYMELSKRKYSEVNSNSLKKAYFVPSRPSLEVFQNLPNAILLTSLIFKQSFSQFLSICMDYTIEYAETVSLSPNTFNLNFWNSNYLAK